MNARQRLDAAMDRLAVKLANAFRERAEKEREEEDLRGKEIAADRKSRGLCQRCGIRKADGSGIMCTACWIETGSPDALGLDAELEKLERMGRDD